MTLVVSPRKTEKRTPLRGQTRLWLQVVTKSSLADMPRTATNTHLIRETEVAIKFNDAASRARPKSVCLATLDFGNLMANQFHFPS